jgi:hypothetical protein
MREIRAAQEAGLGDVYLELARRVERARMSPKGDTGDRAEVSKKLDTGSAPPDRRATIPS